MKKIETWLNEKEYMMLIKRAEKLGITPYALLKALVRVELEHRIYEEFIHDLT